MEEGLDVPEQDKRHRVRVRVHANHNGFFDMSSFTRGREVMGGKKRGEKAKAESLKNKSYISGSISATQSGTDLRPFSFFKEETKS